MQKIFTFLALSLTPSLFSAEDCFPKSPEKCNSARCGCVYCLGPAKPMSNAPFYPHTCNGDVVISISGLYWKATQEGLAYAVSTNVALLNTPPPISALEATPSVQSRFAMNNLINADFKRPNFDWNFGFKMQLVYNNSCDGWTVGAEWTWLKQSSHSLARSDDGTTLHPIWSAFDSTSIVAPNDPLFGPLIAREIATHWKLDLDLIDLKLGRKMWVSPRMTLSPHVGLRIASIDQKFVITHRGGSWTFITDFNSPTALDNQVNLRNDFFGAGLSGGVNLSWILGCGFGFYSKLSTSIVYGKFNLSTKEKNQAVAAPFNKIPVHNSHHRLRLARGMLDLGLGIEWIVLLHDCQYGLNLQLGWEQSTFLGQNQLFRLSSKEIASSMTTDSNNQRIIRIKEQDGSLNTAGWTLKVALAF